MSFDFNNWQDWFRGKEGNQSNRDKQRGYNQPEQNQRGYGYNEGPNQSRNQQQKRTVVEEFQATGQNLVEQVQKLFHESNVRRIRIKREGRVILDIPVVAAVIGGVLAPTIAALGGVAAVATNCTIEVTRDETTPVQSQRRPENQPSRPRENYDDASFR